jgi:type I restriction enzyme S subunit
MTQTWQSIKLSKVLTKSNEWIDIDLSQSYKQVTVKMWGKGVELRSEVLGTEISASKRLQVHPEQFILSRIDARHGAFGLIPNSLNLAVVTNDFPVFNLNRELLLPDFLNWLSKTADFVDICRLASEGTTNRVRLKEDKFLSTEIRLPPIAEQRRIVARIEELAAKIEEARGLRESAIDQLEALYAATLSLIFGETSVDGHLVDVLLDKPRNGWSARCDNMPHGIPVLSLGAVTGFNYRAHEFKRTSEPVSENAHYWLRSGDLLITRSNTPELVGHAAIYNGSPEPCIYPDLMMKLKIDEKKARKKFVHHWLASRTVRDFIQSNAKGTSTLRQK